MHGDFILWNESSREKKVFNKYTKNVDLVKDRLYSVCLKFKKSVCVDVMVALTFEIFVSCIFWIFDHTKVDESWHL